MRSMLESMEVALSVWIIDEVQPLVLKKNWIWYTNHSNKTYPVHNPQGWPIVRVYQAIEHAFVTFIL